MATALAGGFFKALFEASAHMLGSFFRLLIWKGHRSFSKPLPLSGSGFLVLNSLQRHIQARNEVLWREGFADVIYGVRHG
jgi:hypothetical protein